MPDEDVEGEAAGPVEPQLPAAATPADDPRPGTSDEWPQLSPLDLAVCLAADKGVARPARGTSSS